jgi:hypothetical protein
MTSEYNPELCAKMHEELNKDVTELKTTTKALTISDAKHTADIANLTDGLKTFKTAAWGLFASGVLMLIGWLYQLIK